MDRRAPAPAPAVPGGRGVPAPRVQLLAWASALALVSALAVSLSATGAAQPPPLGDPGPAVRWGLPLVTGLGRGAAAVTVGALVLCAAVVSPIGDAALWGRLRRLAALAACAWFVLQAAQLVLAFLDVLGGAHLTAPAQQVDAFLDLGAGRALAAATVLTALVAVATLAARHSGEVVVALLLSAGALFQLAGVGHTGGTVAHGAAVLGLWLHTLAACVWVGGLAALVLVVALGGGPRDGTPAGVHRTGPGLSVIAGRYSALAAWAFVVLAVSGVFSLTVRLEAPADLLTTLWGRLLVAKIVLFAVLGAFGAVHRRHSLPRLERGHPGAFRHLATVELLVMALVLGMSSALARTDPPHSQTPADDPVVALTGYAAPPAPSWLTAVTEVRVEPVTLLLACSTLVVYLRWVRRLRAAGTPWPGQRTVAALAGVAGFAWASNGGLAVYGSVLLSAHLAQQLVLVAVLPVAYVMTAPVSLGLQALPPRDDGSLGPREWLQRAVASRATDLLTRPLVAGVHVAGTLAVLSSTPARGLLLTSEVANVVAVLYLTVVGVFLAVALTRADAGARGTHRGARLVPLLPYLALGLLLGLQLRTSVVLVESWYYPRLALPWVQNPLVDQQTAGGVVWILTVGSALALGWLFVRPRTTPGGHVRADGRQVS